MIIRFMFCVFKQYTLGFSPPNVTKKVLKTALFYLKLAKFPPFNMF